MDPSVRSSRSRNGGKFESGNCAGKLQQNLLCNTRAMATCQKQRTSTGTVKKYCNQFFSIVSYLVYLFSLSAMNTQWSTIFPSEQVTHQQSTLFVKKLLAVAVSKIPPNLLHYSLTVFNLSLLIGLQYFLPKVNNIFQASSVLVYAGYTY